MVISHGGGHKDNYGAVINSASNNEVYVSSSGSANQIVGGSAAIASNNKVVLAAGAKVEAREMQGADNQSYIVGGITGGKAEGGNAKLFEKNIAASNNLVIIGDVNGNISAYVKGNVVGGSAISSSGNLSSDYHANATVTGNKVIINNSTIDGNVFGGIIKTEGYKKVIDNNEIVLNNATINGDIYGGLLLDKTSNDPMLSIPNWKPATESNYNNNSITLSGVNKVSSLVNDGNLNTFNKLNINVDNNHINDPVLTSQKDLNLSNVAVTVNNSGSIADKYGLLKVQADNGQTGQILVNKQTSIDYKSVFFDKKWNFKTEDTIGSELSIHHGTLVDENDKVLSDQLVSLTQTMQTASAKTLSENILGTMALISNGSDFMIGHGLNAAYDATKNQKAAIFAAVEAGKSRFDTGSHVSLTATNAALGFASRIGSNAGEFIVAPYIDFGRGSSDSDIDGISTSGKHTYYGLGLTTAWHHESGLHAEALVRAGKASTKYDGQINGQSVGFDSDAYYAGASVSTGFAWQIKPDYVLDPYVRYSWSRLGDDDVTIDHADADKYSYDAVETQTLRTGLLFKAQLNDGIYARVGAAYEHVFDGDADATLSGFEIVAPSLEGDRGVFDLGFTINPAESALSLDFGVTGYAGDREGVTGNIIVNYKL